eukprot:377373-Rhodomonas_salina.1
MSVARACVSCFKGVLAWSSSFVMLACHAYMGVLICRAYLCHAYMSCLYVTYARARDDRSQGWTAVGSRGSGSGMRLHACYAKSGTDLARSRATRNDGKLVRGKHGRPEAFGQPYKVSACYLRAPAIYVVRYRASDMMMFDSVCYQAGDVITVLMDKTRGFVAFAVNGEWVRNSAVKRKTQTRALAQLEGVFCCLDALVLSCELPRTSQATNPTPALFFGRESAHRLSVLLFLSHPRRVPVRCLLNQPDLMR